MEGKGRGGPRRSPGEDMRHGEAWSLLGVAVAPRRAPRLPPSCFSIAGVEDNGDSRAGTGKV